MPDTNAELGYSATFGIAISPSTTHVVVAEVASITPPGMTRDTVEATHLNSPDAFKEFIAGLKEGGEASITVNYVPAASDTLVTAFDAGRISAQITFPAIGTAPEVTLTFTAIVTAWEPGDLVPDDKMSATFTCKCSGRPVFAVSGA
ncbi:phage tail tube protein [Paracoccus nototheniae]|uniref:Phage tail tube protein n=1 Tax=Paracoccus nototheniae TaxID=2489002 RepID=A0ABW4DYV2_9RHOB|nr:phage tail tube protein [Paracoccus nototheniae]